MSYREVLKGVLDELQSRNLTATRIVVGFEGIELDGVRPATPEQPTRPTEERRTRAVPPRA